MPSQLPHLSGRVLKNAIWGTLDHYPAAAVPVLPLHVPIKFGLVEVVGGAKLTHEARLDLKENVGRYPSY